MRQTIIAASERIIVPAAMGLGLATPPIPTVFPSTNDPVQLAAQQQLLGAEQAAQAQMNQALSSLQSNPNVILQQGDLAKAKAVYDQYAAKSVQALSNIAQAAISGQGGSFSMMAPLIGAMLTAAAVAPVVGAAVAAGLAILDGIAEALNNALNGNTCTDAKTQWTLPGGACVTNPAGRPVGPTLPDGSPNPQWETWAAYEASYRAPNGGPFVGSSGSFDIDNSFPFYAETIGCEIDKLNAMPPGGVRDFFLTYYRAWQHAAEQALNGFIMPSPWTIFVQTLLHWNAQHPGPAVTLQPTSFWGSGSCWTKGNPNDPNGQSYIGGLLNGDIPNSGVPAIPPYKQNLQLNTGGQAEWAKNLALFSYAQPGAATPATTSTATKVAIAGGGIVGAAALTTAIVAWVKGEAFTKVAGKAWDWVKDHVKPPGAYKGESAIPGAHENPLRCPTGSKVVSLLFHRSAWTPARARAWARSHRMHTHVDQVTGDYIHIPQADPSRFARIRTVTYGRGIKARVGWRRC